MIDLIETFEAVVMHGTFSKVARLQNVAASSISRKIDLLEAAFGATLFHRTTRMLVLTDAGERFVPHARRLLAEAADAKASLASIHEAPHGLLSVTAPSSFGRRHVAPAIAAFLQRYPSVEIELDITDDIVDLSARRIDVAIRIGAVADNQLLTTQFARQQRVACASPDYLARAGRPASPADLRDHNCLTMKSASHRIGWWVFGGVNNNKPVPVRGTLRTDNSEALLQATLAGLGIAHLATWLVSDDIAAGRLQCVFDNELEAAPVSGSVIQAVRLPGRAASKAGLLIDFLREHWCGTDGPAHWDWVFGYAGPA
jgi:DNA-binding transcriptional LysR family regulator